MSQFQYERVEPARKTVNGLGVAALVVGILAVMGSWIPFCGLLTIPFAIIGLVLGVVGLLVAMSSKRTGVGFPIMGTLVSGCAIVLAILSTGAGVKAVDDAVKQAEQRQKAAATQPGALTLAKYQQLSDGMSYSQVVQILGSEGTESSSSKVEGVPGAIESISTKLYTWEGPGFSSITATFQNDKLVSKAQFGLK